MRVPTRRSEKYRALKEEHDYHVTADHLARMKKELERLTKAERGLAAAEVARTAEMGDLRENAGYQAAKQHLRRVNDRILNLEDKIARAVVIQKPNSDQVALGSIVHVTFDGFKRVFEIVGVQEANPAQGRISSRSPLGQALMGKKAGDTVELEVQTKKVAAKIIDLK